MPDNANLPLWRFKDRTNNQIYDINAVKLYRAIIFALTGDVGGSVSTDLAGNVDLSTVIANSAVTESKLATDAVTTDKIKDLNVSFEKLATTVYSGSIAEGSADKLATKVQVKNYVESVISGQGTYRGKQTVATINSWTMSNLNNGDRVMVDGSGTVTIDGHSLAVRDGEDLTLWKYVDGGVTHAYWQSHDGEFKLRQTAIDEAGGVGMTLTRIQQDANGDIVATFAQIAVTSAQITDKMSTYDGTGADKTKLVTGEAVKAAIDTLDAMITSSDGTNVQVKVTEVDGKITAVNIVTDNTENRNNKVTSIRPSSTATDVAYPSEKAVAAAIESIETKTGDDSEVVAAALVDLDARIRANEEAISETNLGNRTADSLDAQVLKVGGDDVRDLLAGKVDKVEGKGLSTNDFTDALKNKLDGIAAGAEVNVQSDWNQANTAADDFIKNKPQNLVQDASYVHTDNNFTDAYKNNVDANTAARHSHSNKSVLDGITSDKVAAWDAKQGLIDWMTDSEVDALFNAAWNAANA